MHVCTKIIVFCLRTIALRATNVGGQRWLAVLATAVAATGLPKIARQIKKDRSVPKVVSYPFLSAVEASAQSLWSSVSV
jgi:hypothetical protein